jgi:hypothetical protein
MEHHAFRAVPCGAHHTDADLAKAVRRIEYVIADLDYARLPTKPDVFTACGPIAGLIADDLRMVLAALAKSEGAR